MRNLSPVSYTHLDVYRRQVPEEKLDSEYWFSDEIMLRARFSGKVKFRLIEEYGPSSFTEQERCV